MVTSVVAGGAGFLGSHLVDALVKRGDSVVVIDDLSTGRISNLERAISSGRVTFIYADTSTAGPNLREILLSAEVKRIDFIYAVGRVHSGGDWTERDGCAERTALIELALTHRARFIYASHSYPTGKQRPSNANPSSVLDRLAFDPVSQISDAVRERNLDAQIVHFGTCYGPRGSGDDSFIADLFDAALQRRPFPIRGSGSEVHSLTYIKDAVCALLMIAGRPRATPVPVTLFETGSGSEIEVARMLARTAGVDFAIEHVAELPQSRIADGHSAEAATLDWFSPTSLTDGLRSTYEWFVNEQRQFV